MRPCHDPKPKGARHSKFPRIASCRQVLLFGFSMVTSEPDRIGSESA